MVSFIVMNCLNDMFKVLQSSYSYLLTYRTRFYDFYVPGSLRMRRVTYFIEEILYQPRDHCLSFYFSILFYVWLRVTFILLLEF